MSSFVIFQSNFPTQFQFSISTRSHLAITINGPRFIDRSHSIVTVQTSYIDSFKCSRHHRPFVVRFLYTGSDPYHIDLFLTPPAFQTSSIVIFYTRNFPGLILRFHNVSNVPLMPETFQSPSIVLLTPQALRSSLIH